MSSLQSKLQRIVSATATKILGHDSDIDTRINDEYNKRLEQVGPAPGAPWDQHDTMVSSISSLLRRLHIYIVLGTARIVSGCCKEQ